jgi:uncharacterized membrane protein
MPVLTVELAILLAAAFAAGAVASWLAQDRRARSERRRFELEAQRMIDARRETYEALERQVRALSEMRSRALDESPAPLPGREHASS